MIRHAIGSARRPAPTTLFQVRGRNLATELSLWPGQSSGTVCQRQFVTRTVYTLLNADSNALFSLCLMIDSVMPFRSRLAHGGQGTKLPSTYLLTYYVDRDQHVKLTTTPRRRHLT